MSRRAIIRPGDHRPGNTADLAPAVTHRLVALRLGGVAQQGDLGRGLNPSNSSVSSPAIRSGYAGHELRGRGGSTAKLCCNVRTWRTMTTHDAAPMDDVRTAEQVERIFFEMRRVIVGQSRLLERLLVALLARGHVLLESVPGLAKTLAAETLAHVVGGTFARIQFTPDLLPSDIVGTRIYRGSSERFDVELGPVFVNFLLADEINRAPAKVQSALLEVMGEQQVTIGGHTHQVPDRSSSWRRRTRSRARASTSSPTPSATAS